jgi:hypothetical protein
VNSNSGGKGERFFTIAWNNFHKQIAGHYTGTIVLDTVQGDMFGSDIPDSGDQESNREEGRLSARTFALLPHLGKQAKAPNAI